MQLIRRPSIRIYWLFGLIVLLAACSARLPELQSSLQVGEVQVLSMQSPIETPTPTPTPNAEQQRNATPKPFDSPTPIPHTIVVNEAEGMPLNQIWMLSVERTDGHRDVYLLPLSTVPLDSPQQYKQFRDNLIQLGSDDKIVHEGPAYRSRQPRPNRADVEFIASPPPSLSPDVHGLDTPTLQSTIPAGAPISSLPDE